MLLMKNTPSILSYLNMYLLFFDKPKYELHHIDVISWPFSQLYAGFLQVSLAEHICALWSAKV